MDDSVIQNPWAGLRAMTPARIALGRAGTSLPTQPHLAFQMDHARARKAIHLGLDKAELHHSLAFAGLGVIDVESAAETRAIYLQRPDLGRKLSDRSRGLLAERFDRGDKYDVAFVIADGLSALAIMNNAAGFLQTFLPVVRDAGLAIAPLVLAEQARVAIGDEIGEALNAKQVVVMIGERPGLSSPDSMGLYMTHNPRAGLTDESRNCISNVRQAGMSWKEAAHKLWFLSSRAHARNLSGVNLKDEAEMIAKSQDYSPQFLIG